MNEVLSQLSAESSSSALIPLAPWFLLAVFVVDLFDISISRDESVRVSGALCAATMWILGPVPAMLICLVGTILAHVARWGARDLRRLANLFFARGVALASTLAFVTFSRSFRPTGVFVFALIGPPTFLLSEIFVTQLSSSISTSRPLSALLRGTLSTQAPLLLAQWSASVLIVVTFVGMEAWSLVPGVALLLLMRQSYALLLEVRETYRTTVEVLVEAAESQDARTQGHAERSATAAQAIATRAGLAASQVEIIGYAALLHDVDALIAPSDAAANPLVGRSSTVFEGVDFLSRVLPILQLCDGRCTKTDEYSRDEFMAAIIVALASDADVACNPEMAPVETGTATTLGRFSRFVPADVKALAVSAALSLGYAIPAVN